MTNAELLELIAGKMVVNKYKEIRTKNKYKKIYFDGRRLCPLTFAAKVKSGKYIENCYYDDAAKELGISMARANVIADAADNDLNTRARKKMRKLLLSVVKNQKKEN